MSEVQEVWTAVDNSFGGSANLAPTMTMEDVRRYVRDEVGRLLDQNPGLLMSILYRIDVAESDVQDVLSNSPHEVIPERLADLIIERQVEKLQTRRAYRHESDG